MLLSGVEPGGASHTQLVSAVFARPGAGAGGAGSGGGGAAPESAAALAAQLGQLSAVLVKVRSAWQPARGGWVIGTALSFAPCASSQAWALWHRAHQPAHAPDPLLAAATIGRPDGGRCQLRLAGAAVPPAARLRRGAQRRVWHRRPAADGRPGEAAAAAMGACACRRRRGSCLRGALVCWHGSALPPRVTHPLPHTARPSTTGWQPPRAARSRPWWTRRLWRAPRWCWSTRSTSTACGSTPLRSEDEGWRGGCWGADQRALLPWPVTARL